jgi:hypothetical protein
MKKLILTASVLALMATSARNAQAGDCQWATVGKVFTGVAAGVALANALDCNTHTSVMVGYRAPVICPPPAKVVLAPAPFVYAPRVVYTTPVYVGPAPVLVYSKSGHGHPWGRVHRAYR